MKVNSPRKLRGTLFYAFEKITNSTQGQDIRCKNSHSMLLHFQLEMIHPISAAMKRRILFENRQTNTHRIDQQFKLACRLRCRPKKPYTSRKSLCAT